MNEESSSLSIKSAAHDDELDLNLKKYIGQITDDLGVQTDLVQFKDFEMQTEKNIEESISAALPKASQIAGLFETKTVDADDELQKVPLFTVINDEKAVLRDALKNMKLYNNEKASMQEDMQIAQKNVIKALQKPDSKFEQFLNS